MLSYLLEIGFLLLSFPFPVTLTFVAILHVIHFSGSISSAFILNSSVWIISYWYSFHGFFWYLKFAIRLSSKFYLLLQLSTIEILDNFVSNILYFISHFSYFSNSLNIFTFSPSCMLASFEIIAMTLEIQEMVLSDDFPPEIYFLTPLKFFQKVNIPDNILQQCYNLMFSWRTSVLAFSLFNCLVNYLN